MIPSDKIIGLGQRTLIVAEIGVNHLGNLECGKRLIDAAVRAGADAVKFQSYKAEKLAARDSPLYWEGEVKSQREFFSALDKMPEADFAELIRYGTNQGIDSFSTPFDLETVAFLNRLDVPAYKIASADITYVDLLREVARTGKYLILSTGAATLTEITTALEVIDSIPGHGAVALLACSLVYPCPPDQANLNQILALIRAFPRNAIGWSDHTILSLTPALAVALGACIVERHFGDHSVEGADNAWAADEDELRTIVRLVREAEVLRGPYPPTKAVLNSEMPARELARRSLASACDIPRGGVVTPACVTALRPGGGFPPGDTAIYGKVATRDILEGMLFRAEDFLEVVEP